MLTRKHFREIAEVLKKHNADLKLINAFCYILRQENPRFNPTTFINASLSDKRKILGGLKQENE